MPYEQTIIPLEGGSVLAQCGPMRLVISAWVGRVPQKEVAAQAGEFAFACLAQVARWRVALSRPWREIPDEPGGPIPARMLASVRAVGDEDLTPMAAVAGAIADAVADNLAARAMTKVIVDNGGDVAIRLQGLATARVGIRPQVSSRRISHVLSLDASQSAWGVATSGLGGRSLSRGIASAVTVLAKEAALADAAATAIANATWVADAAVVQRRAEELDPDTDIPGLWVTTEAGGIGEETRTRAIVQALRRADKLTAEGIILGAFISVGGRWEATASLNTRLTTQTAQ